MKNAIGQPGEDIKYRVGRASEQLGEISAVEDVFEGGEEVDENVLGPQRQGKEFTGVECQEPCENGQEWNEKVFHVGSEAGGGDEDGDNEAEEEWGRGDNKEIGDKEKGKNVVLTIVGKPPGCHGCGDKERKRKMRDSGCEGAKAPFTESGTRAVSRSSDSAIAKALAHVLTLLHKQKSSVNQSIRSSTLSVFAFLPILTFFF